MQKNEDIEDCKKIAHPCKKNEANGGKDSKQTADDNH